MRNLFIVFLLLTSISVIGQRAVVVAVHDGDSYGVRFLSRPDTTVYIRLHNVDAPEQIFYVTKDQPYARKAAKNMRNYLVGDTADVTVVYRDVFNRMVCDVMVDSVDITEYVIATGNGWYQSDSATTLEREAKLKALQQAADKADVGLWGEKGRKLRPETWRRKYSRRALEGQ